MLYTPFSRYKTEWYVHVPFSAVHLFGVAMPRIRDETLTVVAMCWRVPELYMCSGMTILRRYFFHLDHMKWSLTHCWHNIEHSLHQHHWLHSVSAVIMLSKLRINWHIVQYKTPTDSKRGSPVGYVHGFIVRRFFIAKELWVLPSERLMLNTFIQKIQISEKKWT